MSSPNQRVVQIEKPKYEKNFLQIGEDEWTEAFTRLKPSAFGIYLYLANNANGYKLELSQKAVENKLGIKKSTYHEAVANVYTERQIELIARSLVKAKYNLEMEDFYKQPSVNNEGCENK